MPTYEDIAYPATGFWGGTVADNGLLYYTPYSATTGMKVDPSTDTISTFGSLPGGNKYIGLVKASNGMLYGIPYDALNILKIDPSTDTISTFGSLSGTNKYVGGCLAANGKIYSFPFRASGGQILEIDPATDTIRQFGSVTGSDRCIGTVLGSNGLLYGIPYNLTQIAKLDPATDSITYFATLSGAAAKYNGGFLGPDNKIYCSPRAAGNWLVIDTALETIATIGSGASQCLGSFLTPGGIGFGVSFSSNSELNKLDINAGTSELINVSGIAGGGYSGLLAPNGSAYTVPGINNNQLKINNLGSVSPSDFIIPANLNDLPTSNYNRYINKL